MTNRLPGVLMSLRLTPRFPALIGASLLIAGTASTVLGQSGRSDGGSADAAALTASTGCRTPLASLGIEDAGGPHECAVAAPMCSASTSSPSFDLGSVTRRIPVLGEAVSTGGCAERIAKLGLDDDALSRTHDGAWGVVKSGLIGAVVGFAVGGVVEIWEPDPEFIDVWPTVTAVPGFVVGLIVGLVR